jgi:hypothetical protein
LKEGVANQKMQSAFHCELALNAFLKEYGESGKKQILRNLKQMKAVSRSLEIINEGKGEDQITGKPVNVFETNTADLNYDSELNGIIRASKISGTSMGLIDNCLWIYVFNGNQNGEKVLQEFADRVFAQAPHIKNWLEKYLGIAKLFPVINLLTGEIEKVTKPLVLRNLKPEDLTDILTKRMHVLLFMDWEKLSELVILHGGQFRWSTKAESKKYLNMPQNEKPIIIGESVPIVTNGKKDIIIGGGAFCRVVYDGTKPDVFAQTCVECLTASEISKGI